MRKSLDHLCIYNYFLWAFLVLNCTLLKLQVSLDCLREISILQYKLLVKVLHKLLDSLAIRFSAIFLWNRFRFDFRLICWKIAGCCMKCCLIIRTCCCVASLSLSLPCVWFRFACFNSKLHFGNCLNLGLSELVLFYLRTWSSTFIAMTFLNPLLAQHWSPITLRNFLMLRFWQIALSFFVSLAFIRWNSFHHQIIESYLSF